ncbi:MAG: DNA repair exonuclease [Acidimicrobiales bacterium]|nr:DNA repair exonuclease [Acidimicrobiales bacterium]
MKFIHAADLHIDSPMRGLASYEGSPIDEIRGKTRLAFVELVDLAIVREVDFVLIAGDIFDSDWKDYSTGIFFSNQINRLAEENIEVIMIAGNHDAVSQITKNLTLPPKVYKLSSTKPERVILEHLDTEIIGQSFHTRSVPDNLVLGYPDGDPSLFSIGLLHTSLNGRPGHDPYAPCTYTDLASKGYQYWALGHVHNREVVSEDPWIVFPGNLQGRHIRESGSKGITLVETSGHEIQSVDHIELGSLYWQLVSISHSSTGLLEEVERKLVQSMKPSKLNIIRVELTLDLSSSLSLDHENLQAEIYAIANSLDNIWIEKIKFKSSEPSQLISFNDELLDQLKSEFLSMRSDVSAYESIREEHKQLSSVSREVFLELTEYHQLQEIIDESFEIILDLIKGTDS